MDTIPPEILAQVVNSLPEAQYKRAKLARYSMISRAWKACIERHLYRDLHITTDELDAFPALFSGEGISRREDLTSLSVTFILPIPPTAIGSCPVIQTPDRRAGSVAFSASVAKLFTILADLEARATEKKWRLLTLRFDRANRRSKIQGEMTSRFWKCKLDGRSSGQHTKEEIRTAILVSGHFELVREDTIPILHGFATFQSTGHDYLHDLKPTWIPKIVARLPDLKRLLLGTDDPYCNGRRIRNEQEKLFGASIRSLTDLREIQLNIQSNSMDNESLPVPKFVDNSNWRQESWFCMLNYLATLLSLAILKLHGGLVICPQFFQAIVDHPGTPFPSLVEFELQFLVETADGRWFYERDNETLERSRSDPEYDEFWEEEDEEPKNYTLSLNSEEYWSDEYVRVFEDEPSRTKVVFPNRYRSLPSATIFLPFLMDASKAALRVPNLQKFILRLGYPGTRTLSFAPIVSRVFELWYLKAGMHRSPQNTQFYPDPDVHGDAVYLHRNRLYWRVDGAKLWDEVRAAWGAVAGPDAKIVFLEEKQWDKHPHSSIEAYKGDF